MVFIKDRFGMNWASENIPVCCTTKGKLRNNNIFKDRKSNQELRWKALTFLGKIVVSKHRQNYGFYTTYCAAVEELTEFELDSQLMTKNMIFKKIIILFKHNY